MSAYIGIQLTGGVRIAGESGPDEGMYGRIFSETGISMGSEAVSGDGADDEHPPSESETYCSHSGVSMSRWMAETEKGDASPGGRDPW